MAHLALLATGCRSTGLPRLHLSRAEVAPANHVHTGSIPATVRRVVVLPLHTDAWRAGEIAGVDAALRTELARVERFELTTVSRSELHRRFAHESFASSSALPADFLARLRDDYGADAVLFLDLSHFAPYQPIALGVRAKLVTTNEGAPLWSADTLFDSSRNEIAAAARKFGTDQRRAAPAAEDNTGILQSPSRFAKYVGHALFETLPPRRTE